MLQDRTALCTALDATYRGRKPRMQELIYKMIAAIIANGFSTDDWIISEDYWKGYRNEIRKIKEDLNL